MSSTIQKHDDIAVIQMEGAVDWEAMQALKERMQHLRKEGVSKIVLDFANVNSIKSTVLKEFLTPIRALTLVNGVVGFCNMSTSVHRTLQTGMFYKGVNVYDTLEDALQAMRAQS